MDVLSIDLNADLGEGMPHDADLMAWISSANIACGGHAGDEKTMRMAVRQARENKVAIGAHPSFADPEHFGRKEMPEDSIHPEKLVNQIYEQVEKLQAICQEEEAVLHHIKPHGALYNQAARNATIARCICLATLKANPSLFLYGPGNSALAQQSAAHGLRFVQEVFADRRYTAQGMLVPRTDPAALITGVEDAVGQVLRIIEKGSLVVGKGEEIHLPADTVCIHGDSESALSMAATIYNALMERGIRIQAP